MKKFCFDYSKTFNNKLDKKGCRYNVEDFGSDGEKKIIIPNYNEPILRDLDLFKTRGDKTYYRGSPFYSMVTLLYIKNKFPNACVIIPLKKKKMKFATHEDLSIRYNEKINKVVIPKNFWNYFYKCTKKRYVVFPFGYSCKDGSGHANILIYDSIKKTLERFEPYGDLNDIITDTSKGCFSLDIDKIFFKMFNDRKLINQYFPPSTFIADKGFQKVQENENRMSRKDPVGFCTMWSAFYCDLRLSNPDVKREKLLDYTVKVFNNNGKSLTNFIRDYSNIITELAPCFQN